MNNINSANNNNLDTRTNNTNMRTTPPLPPSQNIQRKSEISMRSEAFSEDQIIEQASGTFDPTESRISAAEFFNQQRISPENFSAFCEQLHSFVQCVKNIQDITNLTYSLPSRLQESLDEEAKELDCLYGEVREATSNIERIKAQRKAIRKEKYAAEKLLKKLKEEETREMETVISVYDRGMFARWEIIKNSKKLEAVENFLCDIEGKLLAMKHLKILATQKMNKVITWTIKESTDKRNRKESKRNTGDKDSSATTASSSVTDQEIKRKRTRQPRLSKTDLPRIETISTATSRTPIYSTMLHTPDDNDINDRSHDSIRAVELNSEMQSVLRTLFGGPARRETSVPNTQVQTNNTTTSTTATNSTQSPVNDNREIHIYLSHSYQN